MIYIRHIILIRQISYSNSITETQKKISALQTSTINIGRVLWAQLPFHTTWFWSSRMIDYSTWKTWLIPIPVTLLFVFAAIWLLRNISLKNADKKWFRILFGSTEWTSLIKAKNFLHEIEDFKKELE